MDVSSVARRARTENFPVASLLFPRRLRPHLRAVYGFARLVDILGDEVEGDRLLALDELEAEVDRCYSGVPEWPVMKALQPNLKPAVRRARAATIFSMVVGVVEQSSTMAAPLRNAMLKELQPVLVAYLGAGRADTAVARARK